MTEAEELELLELEEEEARLAGGVPVAAERPGQSESPPDVGGWESAGRGALDSVLFGFDDEAGGALRAVGRKLAGDQRPTADVYREGRDSLRLKKGAARESNPWTYGLSGLAPALAMIPFSGGSSGISALRAIGMGAAAGGLGGLGASNADLTEGDVSGALGDTAIGAGVGGVLGGALHGVGSAARWFGRSRAASPAASGAVRGVDRLRAGAARAESRPAAAAPQALDDSVSPEARRLLDQGIDLTMGQRNPKSAANYAETANQSVAVIGPTIRGQRERAAEQWRDLLISKGAAPGKDVSRGAPHSSMIEEMASGFDEVYDSIRAAPAKAPVDADELERLAALAVDDPNVMRTPKEQRAVIGFLQDQIGAIRNAGSNSVSAMMNVRHRVRQLADALPESRLSERQMLKTFEGDLSSELGRILPPDMAKLLQQTDAQYSTFKVLESAVGKAKDRPEGFTSNMISSAVKEATDAGPYARGAGALRQLVRDGVNVFDTKIPETGARALMAAPGIKYPVAAANAAINSPVLKPYAAGRGLGQPSARALGEALRRSEGPLPFGYLNSNAGGGAAGLRMSAMDPEEFERLYGRSPWE